MVDAYPRVPRAIERAEWVDDSGQHRLVYFHEDGDLLVAVIEGRGGQAGQLAVVPAAG